MRTVSVIFWLGLCSMALAQERSFELADDLRLTGRYEESAEMYDSLRENDLLRGTIGIARCQQQTGQIDDAHKMYLSVADKFPKTAELSARLAELEFDRGSYSAAQDHVDAALKIDKDHLLARWVAAELHRVRGELPEAEAGYEWFVDYYNENDVKSAESIHLIAKAAAEFARWKRNSEQFSGLVNNVLPSTLEAESNYWPARLESALLYMEKYNDAAATDELNAALQLNPNAAAAYAARARLALQSFEIKAAQSAIDQALTINPRELTAIHAQADMLMLNFETGQAIDVLEKSLKWNPSHEGTLGRLAAAYGSYDGLQADPAGTRMGRLIEQAIESNKHCGEFFFELASALDAQRKYPRAAIYYAEAHKRMPQLLGPRSQLGLMYMRLGEEGKAAEILNEAFDVDPFNVRVKNMLTVLEVLENYAVIESEHFIIRFDRTQDELLARYALDYLENDVYPDIVQKLGYEPPDKSLFEIFSRARNTSGHGWFSARMVGLPNIGTVGACAGKMVAITSPNDLKQPFHWSRVLKHEFVHVVNLQQTNFNIPHWFTEALAVWNEGYPRPPEWIEILARRKAAGTLFNLDTINLGFVRPKDGADWTLAYCQAELYAEYMVAEYGEDSLAKMLKAYAENRSTSEAIEACFGAKLEDFESGYTEYIGGVADKAISGDERPSQSLAELQRSVKENPQNAQLIAELAYAYLQRGANPQARRLAIAAQQRDAKNQLAAYVLARLMLSIGDVESALELLENAFDEDEPHERTLLLLAALKLKAEDFAEAERLYRIGETESPHPNKWLKVLAKVYLKNNNADALAETLSELAALDTDNLTIAKKLAETSLAKEDYEAAAKWARRVVHINVKDAQAHAIWAKSLAARKQFAPAIEEFMVALQLEPDQTDWYIDLAKTHINAGENDNAEAILESVLKNHPGHAGATALLEGLDR